MNVLQTERLDIRWLNADDAGFIRELVNDAAWLQYIGDKGIKTLVDAQRYISEGPVAMYRRLGFGLNVVELRESGEPIGICGLIKRDALDQVDLGFAFLPAFRGRGYAFEAASAVMSLARRALNLHSILAITTLDNRASVKLLERLGFQFERMVQLQTDNGELALYAA